jgi:hypothetical protein
LTRVVQVMRLALWITNNGVKRVDIFGEINLIGNPYPSAIDGDAFILANSGDSSVLSGTLYFGRMDLRCKLEAY